MLVIDAFILLCILGSASAGVKAASFVNSRQKVSSARRHEQTRIFATQDDASMKTSRLRLRKVRRVPNLGSKHVPWKVPERKLAPPFPDGPCGGTIVTLPPEETYGIDVGLSGNSLMLPPRSIRVWLPPDYDLSTIDGDASPARPRSVRPVLYMHDGENAFDSECWTGHSWRLIGALTRLHDHKRLRCRTNDTSEGGYHGGLNDFVGLPIVVMLPSMSGDLIPGVRRRHLEYGDTILPFARAHVQFVGETVRPLVDARFRPYLGPILSGNNRIVDHQNYLIGASMGGQAALNILLEYPDYFSGAACLSPFFSPSILQRVQQLRKGTWQRRHGPQPRKKKIYLDIGGDLDEITVPWLDVGDHLTLQHAWNPGYFWLDTSLQMTVQMMREMLLQRTSMFDMVYREFPGARHNERAWSQRIHEPLEFLFGKESSVRGLPRCVST